MIRELFKDMGKYLPSYIVPAIVSFFAIPIITRLFPPEDYGNYVLVIATVSVFSAMTTAWIGASVIRFFPVYNRQQGTLDEFYSTVIKLMFLSIISVSLIMICGLLLTHEHFSEKIYSLMQIGILMFLASGFWSVLVCNLRAKRKVTNYSFFTIWRSIAGLGFGVALIAVLHYGVDGLLWGQFLSMVIILPLLWNIALGKVNFKYGRIHSLISKEIAKYGFPVAIVNLGTWILSLSDRYFLEFFRGSQEVGIYSASYAVSEKTIFLVASFFMMAEGPIAFKTWETKDIEENRDFRSKIMRYYLIVALPAAVGLSILAKPAINILTAPEYHAGYKIVPLVVFGAFLIGIAHRFIYIFGFYKRTDINMYCVLGSGLLNVGLNFIFVPKYGYIAAAATTFVSYAFLLLSAIVVSRRFFVWKFPFKSLAKIVFASVVMGVIVYPIGNSLTSSTILNLILGISVGVVVYVLMLFLLREPKKEEIQELHAIKERILKRLNLAN